MRWSTGSAPFARFASAGSIAVIGGVLVVLAPNPVVAMAGFGLIGLGVAVVVPLAFVAAAMAGPNAEQAIAGVATITYASGLVAPSIIGGIAQASNLTVSFIVVTVLTVGLAVFAPVLRPPDRLGPTCMRRCCPGGEELPGPRRAGHVLEAGPLSREPVEGAAVLATQHAGEGAPVELDRLQHFATSRTRTHC